MRESDRAVAQGKQQPPTPGPQDRRQDDGGYGQRDGADTSGRDGVPDVSNGHPPESKPEARGADNNTQDDPEAADRVNRNVGHSCNVSLRRRSKNYESAGCLRAWSDAIIVALLRLSQRLHTQ